MSFEPEIATIVGYRVFNIAGETLASISADYTWDPGWNEASCGKGRRHQPPASGCGCGFWVYRTMVRAIEQFSGDLGLRIADQTGYGDFDGLTGVVLARVQVAGRLVVGTDGYRAQRAGVVAVYAEEPDLVASIGANYGVPVEPMPVIDWPVRGLLTDVDDRGLRVLVLEGKRRFRFEVFRIEKGSATHLEATAAAGGEVEVAYERRGDERWVTGVTV